MGARASLVSAPRMPRGDLQVFLTGTSTLILHPKMMGLKAITQPACVCFGRFYDLLKRGVGDGGKCTGNPLGRFNIAVWHESGLLIRGLIGRRWLAGARRLVQITIGSQCGLESA